MWRKGPAGPGLSLPPSPALSCAHSLPLSLCISCSLPLSHSLPPSDSHTGLCPIRPSPQLPAPTGEQEGTLYHVVSRCITSRCTAPATLISLGGLRLQAQAPSLHGAGGEVLRGKNPPRRLPSKQDMLNAILDSDRIPNVGDFSTQACSPRDRELWDDTRPPLPLQPPHGPAEDELENSPDSLDWPPCNPAEGTALLSQGETQRQVGLGVLTPVGFGRVTQGEIPLAPGLRSPQRLCEPPLWSGDGPPSSLHVERSHQTPS